MLEPYLRFELSFPLYKGGYIPDENGRDPLPHAAFTRTGQHGTRLRIGADGWSRTSCLTLTKGVLYPYELQRRFGRRARVRHQNLMGNLFEQGEDFIA